MHITYLCICFFRLPAFFGGCRWPIYLIWRAAALSPSAKLRAGGDTAVTE